MDDFDALYYKRPFVTEFDADVTACTPGKNGFLIELSQTAFYPEGGGQPADHGILHLQNQTEVHVLDVRNRDGHILHRTDCAIAVGTMVHGEIDRVRRLDHTEAHSGEHIISGLIHKHFGFENVGFHMGDEVTTIDISGTLSWEELMEIEREANAIIRQDVPVEESFPDAQELENLAYRSKKELTGTVRIITIPGADVCACCGTHVLRTGEIGMIKCLSLIHYKKGVRIELLCGRRALVYYQQLLDQNREISHQLSVKPHETAAAVEKLQEECSGLQQRMHRMVERYFARKIMQMDRAETLLIDFERGIDTNSCRKFCDRLVKESMAPTCAVLTTGEEDAGIWYYTICSSVTNLRNLSRMINQNLDGRGGGSPEMIQGSFRADQEKIRAVLSAIFEAETEA
ncbi:MAG: alanyl-tRNA editing protein [Bilifractor sp.]